MQNIISITGLAIGFTCFALSSLWIHHELTYDSFHKDADRIYAAGHKGFNDNSVYSGATSPLLADYLKAQFPEIEQACSMRMTLNKIKGNELKTLEIDSAFFSVLPVALVAGSMQFLNHFDEAAITERTARRLFGDESPIGKHTDDGKVITAIVKDWDGHSNFQFELLTQHSQTSSLSWNVYYRQTLFRIKENVNLSSLEEKLLNIKVDLPDFQQSLPTLLTPLTKLHYAHPPTKVNVSLDQLRLFAWIGSLVVISSLFNYLIIYHIRLRMRQREMSLRKVSGATDRSLIFMFSTELILMLLGALLAGMFLIEVSLPAFSDLSQIMWERTYFYTESSLFIGLAALLAFLLSLAVIASRKQAPLTPSGNYFSGKPVSMLFNKIALCLQLVIGLGFTFCTIVVTQQIRYVYSSEDMGVTRRNIGIITNCSGIEEEALHKYLKEYPSIQAEFLNSIPLPIWGHITYSVKWDGMPEDASRINAEEHIITKRTLELFDLKLLQGTLPENDGTSWALINEKMAHALGWEQPINKKFNKYTVAGVLKDVQLSAITPACPAYYRIEPEYKNKWTTCIFTYQGELKDIEEGLNKRIKQDHPNFQMSCTSIRRIIEDELVSERIFMQLLGISSTVCVLTAIFGVFSLVSLSCRQRRKEIAIRKVNGATSRSIFTGFIKEYVLLIAISATIAFPIGYFCIQRWIEGFVVQIEISPWIYVCILGTIAIIMFACIGWNVWKASSENPAEVIKSE